MLHAIGDFERIGDHAVNIQESAQELHDKELRFSDSAREELQVLLSALDDILDLTIRSFQAADMETARRVEPLEETIDQLIEEIRSRHIQRLQAGQCTIQLGFVLSDLLTNIEREMCIRDSWRSGSDTVTMTPIRKPTAATTQSFLERVMAAPTRSPMGVMAVSAPRENRPMPRITITAPIRKASSVSVDVYKRQVQGRPPDQRRR